MPPSAQLVHTSTITLIFLVTNHLKQQLQACSGFDVSHADTWSTENLDEDAKQKTMLLTHMLNAQYARQLQVSGDYLQLYMHSAAFAERERTVHESTMEKLAAQADFMKSSLDAANQASARSESAFRSANKRST